MRLAPWLLLTACHGGLVLPDKPSTDEPLPVDTDPDTDPSTDTDEAPGDSAEPILDPGCIEVDGSGTYNTLGDALAAATDGSTLTLCAGTWVESAVVDKAVRILGAGADRTVIQGDLSFTAAGSGAASLRVDGGITFSAPGNGLRQVEVGRSAGACVESTSEGLLLDEVLLDGCATGLRLDGGRVDLVDAIIRGGILGIDAADAVVDVNGLRLDNLVDGVILTGGSLQGGDLHTSVTQTAVLATDSELVLEGITLTGGEVGIDLQGGSLTLVESTVQDVRQTGLHLRGTAWVEGLLLDVDPAVVAPASDPATWNGSDSTGLVFEGSDITILGSTLGGYANAGLVLQGPGNALLGRVTLENHGRVGARIRDFTTQSDGLTIRETGTTDAPCDTRSELPWHAGLVVEGGLFSMDNAGISGNRGVGVLGVGAEVVSTSSTFRGNQCAGLIADGGILISNGSTYDDGRTGPYGGGLVCLESPSFTSSGDIFRGDGGRGLRWATEQMVLGDLVREEEFGAVGLDLHLIGCPDLTVEGNQHSGGGRGILAERSTGAFVDTFLEGPGDAAVTLLSDSDLRFDNLVVDSYTGPALLVTDSTLEVSALETIGGSDGSVQHTTRVQGVITEDVTSPRLGHGLQATESTITLDAATFEDASSDALRALESTVTLDSATIGTPARHGAVFTGCEVEMREGRLYGATHGVQSLGGTLLLEGMQVEDGRGHGVEALDDTIVTVSESAITGMGGYGMVCTSARSVRCTDVTLRDNGSGPVLDCPSDCIALP